MAGVTYNAAGEPTNISIGSGSDYDGYAYDNNTLNMTGWTFQVNSVQESGVLTWNSIGSLKSLAITDGFNANGSITCRYNSSLVTGTGYDDLNRLIGDSCTGTGGTWSQAFAYDQYDNITKTGSGLPSWNPGYSATTNHYTCTGCTTDSNGNVTNDGTNAYTWNAFSKMASVNMSGSGCSTSGDCIIYDAFGRAVEFDNGSTKTEIWYSPIGKHYLNGTTPLYGYEAAPGGGTIFGSGYMHKDWIGSARVISSITASTITTDRAVAPYGEVFNIFGGTGQSDIMFAGLDQGIFAGMYDTPNRELQAVQSRFMSPDPADSGWNQYAYPTNPNSIIDPSGLRPKLTCPGNPTGPVGCGFAGPDESDTILYDCQGAGCPGPYGSYTATGTVAADGGSSAGDCSQGCVTTSSVDTLDGSVVGCTAGCVAPSLEDQIASAYATFLGYFGVALEALSHPCSPGVACGIVFPVPGGMSGNLSLAGYELAATWGMVGDTFTMNISMSTVQGEGLGALTGEIVSMAQDAGASNISVTASMVTNEQLADPILMARVASQYGWTYQQINSTTFVLTMPVP